MTGTVMIVQKGKWLPAGVLRFYVGRPSVLGNPFSHLPRSLGAQKVATREEAVHRHEVWLDGLPRDSPQWLEIEGYADLVREGRTIALECFCGDSPPLGHCHATTIGAEIMRLALREAST